ncbi:MAG: hypothetical protein PHY48_17525 [Candidatus Cloacimonetes bacterium]|nr:hypothetical protein [Candidatus Cloacimonadota bacterium]
MVSEEDLDWYAIDKNNIIAHFASGVNGVVPKIYLDNPELSYSLHKYMYGVLECLPTSEWRVHQTAYIKAGISLLNIKIRNRYRNSIASFASKGFVCFDSFCNTDSACGYFQVSCPAPLIKLDSMPQSSENLKIIRLPLSFVKQKVVNAEELSNYEVIRLPLPF